MAAVTPTNAIYLVWAQCYLIYWQVGICLEEILEMKYSVTTRNAILLPRKSTLQTWARTDKAYFFRCWTVVPPRGRLPERPLTILGLAMRESCSIILFTLMIIWARVDNKLAASFMLQYHQWIWWTLIKKANRPCHRKTMIHLRLQAIFSWGSEKMI